MRVKRPLKLRKGRPARLTVALLPLFRPRRLCGPTNPTSPAIRPGPLKQILVQLDCGDSPSVFDAVVAVDAGADILLRQPAVTPANVTPHVHGAIFTRGPKKLHHTALFVGGDDVSKADAVLAAVKDAFFGPMRVSVLCDPNGSNTTAAAAVHLASRHVAEDAPVVVLGSGPVGGRVARMTSGRGRPTTILGRDAGRSADAAKAVADVPGGPVSGTAYGTDEANAALRDGAVLVACGKAGVTLLDDWQSHDFAVAVDLNAVPPAGLPGIDVTDFAADHDGTVCYGALGVGGPKMKVHKAAIARLFERNDLVLDAEEVLALADELLSED